MSERAGERMSAAENASEASSAEQANEWAVRANERVDEREAQHSTRRFHSHSTHCATLSRCFFPVSVLVKSVIKDEKLKLLWGHKSHGLTNQQRGIYISHIQTDRQTSGWLVGEEEGGNNSNHFRFFLFLLSFSRNSVFFFFFWFFFDSPEIERRNALCVLV